ncbi:class I SAM-dependent methyltransferase [Telluribacter sp.]|uniref:class I SAM-dependent methyltransferase n=1 Tax=Telluribacter sp. TaxID=1978767 RepID=UPI002E155FEE|nr:methyltransferase domain-containing protein [Telluribacter sp.]
MAWYHTFFEGLPQQAWKLNQNEEYTLWEVDFLADVLELQPDAQVLDVFGGYGRHALPLAQRGYQLTSVDIAPDYCRELSQAASAQGLPIEVICGDFLTVPLADTTFQAAYCLGNSFSFFPYEQMVQFLRRISQLLELGAQLVVHTELVAESVLPHFVSRSWMPVGESEELLFLMNSTYDPLAGCIEAELTYVQGTERLSHTVQQYIYSLAELKRMFSQAGLTITETFSDLEGELFRLGDEQLYLLAVKNFK